MEEHEAMFAQLEERVQRVLAMLEDMRSQNRELQEQISQLEQEGSELRRTIDTQSQRIEELLYLEAEAAELRRQKAGVRDQLAHIIQMLDGAAGVTPGPSVGQVPPDASESEPDASSPADAAVPEPLLDAEVLAGETELEPTVEIQIEPVAAPESEEMEPPEAEDAEAEIEEDQPPLVAVDTNIPDRPFQSTREPLTPGEIAELSVETGDKDTFEEAIFVSDDDSSDLKWVDAIEAEPELDSLEEPELAGSVELEDFTASVEFSPEEESAIALIFQHDQLEESELEQLMQERGFEDVRIKALIDQIIEKGMRIQQNLVQMRFEKGSFYYRRHPDAQDL